MADRDSAVSGAAWNLSTGIATRAIGLIGTLVVTRFVSPGEYGAVSAALVCALTASRVVNLGLGSYVIAYRTDPEVTFQAAIFHTAATAVACGSVVAVGGPLAAFLAVPTLTTYLPGLALATVLTQLPLVPAATLARQFRFRTVATSRATGEAVQTALAVTLAPWIGGMALVVGGLARSLIICAMVLARADRHTWWAPCRFRWATLRSFLSFGIPTAGASLTETATSNWDNLLVARLFGPTVMGQYNLSYNLGTTPSAHVAEHINDVLLPSFAAVEASRRGPALARVVALMGLLIFPLALGLAAISPRLIAAILDPRWAAMAPMLAILSGISVARPLSLAVESYLRSERRPRAILALGLVKLVAMVVFIYLARPLGPLGACVGVVLAFFLHSALCLAALENRSAAASVCRAAAPPLAAALLMASTVWIIDRLLGGSHLGGWPLLLIECALGGLSYAAYALLVARPLVREAAGLARTLVQRPAAGVAS